MSADRWSKCPRCGGDVDTRRSAAYGTIPREEYERLIRVEAAYPPETLREDWEIFLRDGRFYVSYGAMCLGGEDRKGCGFSFEFKHEEAVPSGAWKP